MQPEKMEMEIGGFGGSRSRIVWQNNLLYFYRGLIEQERIIEPSEEQWNTFLVRLEELRVWDWQENYHVDILDGIQWSIEMAFKDRSIKSWGNNCYPAKNNDKLSSQEGERTELFKNFLGAVSELIGERFYR